MKPFFSLPGTVLCLASLLACNLDRAEVGPSQTLPVSVEAGGAERANIELDMGAGEMRLSGGSAKLMEGTFDYNVAGMKPKVTSSRNGVNTTITVRQAKGSNSFGKVRNVWDLQLGNSTLLDLAVNCGAGQARMNVGDLLLRDLTVSMGAGQLDLDLTGKPRHDYQVTIHGGVGQATIHLPNDVGIWANVHGGIGSVNVEGLQKRGDHWENDSYDKAKVNVRVEVNGGIGEIHLIS